MENSIPEQLLNKQKEIKVVWASHKSYVYIPMTVFMDGNAHVREELEKQFPEYGTVVDWSEVSA